MEKTYYLISNAHIDPVWQWEWEEGAAEAVSTFRCAVKFCRTFGNYIFCHNEAILYRWIEEYEPELFEDIRELVKAGKWHIMGGWYLQPDCNMPSGEGFTRNISEGRRYFEEKFGKAPTTAINFDPFGHTRGLVQIMKEAGYDSYLFCRPSQEWINLPADVFSWVGYDGSKVTARRVGEGYGSALGHAVDKIKSKEPLITDKTPVGCCLWGVGDHGGGASIKDLEAIDEYIKNAAERGITVKHSTPEEFFAAIRQSGQEIPEYAGDLNPWAVGCYTSQVRVKQKYRATENMLFFCEKMCAQLASQGKFTYPREELAEATRDLLTVQFHDSLPGSSIQPVEEMAIRIMDHAYEILSRVRMRAFVYACKGQPAAKDGELPIFCYNPHPYEVEGDFFCEFMLADQNWSDAFMMPEVYANGEKIPAQCTKEMSNVPLDWRKRVTFHSKLAPMSLSRYDCRFVSIPKKPVPHIDGQEDGASHLTFTSDFMSVKFNKKTGLIDSVNVGGKEYFKENALTLDVVADNADPWGMTIRGWWDKIGQFTLLDDETASEFMDLDSVIPALHVIEDGQICTSLEAVYGYGRSYAIVKYILSKTAPTIDLEVRIFNNEKSKLIRLALPHDLKNAKPSLEVAFGEEPMLTNGEECVGQKYMKITGDDGIINVYNKGIYGYSYLDGVARLTLLRSAGYTTHPLPDRNPLPQDRYSAHIDQGERIFPIRLEFGVSENIGRRALAYNEEPMTLSFFPSGAEAPEFIPALEIAGGEVYVSAFKQAYDGNGFIVRAFNPTDREIEVTLKSPLFDLSKNVFFGKYKVKTFRINNSGITECDLLEK